MCLKPRKSSEKGAENAPRDPKGARKYLRMIFMASILVFIGLAFIALPIAIVWTAYGTDPSATEIWERLGAAALIIMSNGFIVSIWMGVERTDPEPGEGPLDSESPQNAKRALTEQEKRFGRASTYVLAALIFAIAPTVLVWAAYNTDPATVTVWDMAGASLILPLANAMFFIIWRMGAKRDFEPPREGIRCA